MRARVRAGDLSQGVWPAPALLSPPWLLALALLILNDRWLKYADVAPDLLTGKLSDLAGMLVAPTLLAVLLGVRRRGGLLACHVAVAVVFAAIKLSPACAGTWSWAMGLFGYPWTIVCDPTDLLALPCLLVSWHALLPHMDPERSPLVPLQRSAVAGLAGLGLWSSVATTEAPVPPPFYEDVYGQLYLHNAGDVSITLHVRPLRGNVSIDCDEVALDPGRLLSPEAFDDAEYWLLDPGVNIGIEFPLDDCGAAWVAGDGLEATIVFIDLDDYPQQLWPGFEENDEDSVHGELALETDEQGKVEWLSAQDIRFVPHTDAPEQPQACEPPPADSRIDWSKELPEFASELVALDTGLDGCFELTLQDWVLDGVTPVPFEFPYAWYLCAPAPAMPFVAGDFIGFDLTQNHSGTHELTLTLLDGATLLPMTNGIGVPLRNVRLLHGGTGPKFVGPAIDRDLEAVHATECPWLLEPGCATAERSAQMREVGSTDPIPVGQPVMFNSSLVVRTMVLTHMRERAVVDQQCTDGAAILNYDIDLALIEEPG